MKPLFIQVTLRDVTFFMLSLVQHFLYHPP